MTVATKGRPQVAAEAETVPRRCVGLLGQGHLIPQAASDRPAQAILLLRCKSASLGFAARGGMLVQWVICHFKRHQIDRHKQSSFFAANPLRSALPRGGDANVLRQRATSHPAALDALLLLCPIILNFVPFCVPIIHPYPSECKSKKADRKKLRSARRVCVIPSFFSASFPEAHRPLTGAAPSASPPRG